jgi:hypothetical protein
MHGALWVHSGQISVAPPAAGKEVPISAHLPFFIEIKGKSRKSSPNKLHTPQGPNDGSNKCTARAFIWGIKSYR